MKKALQKIVTAGLISAMAIGTLAGCGSSNETASTPSQPAESKAEASTEAAAESTEAGDTAAAGEFTDYSAGFPETVTLQVPVYERGWEGWNPTDNYWTKWIQENFGDKYNVNVEFVSLIL